MNARRAFPSLVTAVGFACGLVALAVHLPPLVVALLLVASLALDAADGVAARRLRATSELGASFDWTVDVALSFAIAWVFFSFPWAVATTCALVLLQTVTHWLGVRASGRTAVTIAAVFTIARLA